MTASNIKGKVLDKYVFDEPEGTYGCGIRHVIAVLTLLGALVTYIQRFSFGLILAYITTMRHVKIDPDSCEKPSATPPPSEKGEFDWSQETQGYITLSFFVGYVLSHLGGGYLADRFGPKHVLGGSMILSTVFTFLSPISAKVLNAGGMAGARFFIGFVQGPIFPCLSVVLSHWSPKRERGVMGTLMFAGAQLGIVVSFLTTPSLMKIWEWPATFYTYGVVGIVYVILWYIIFYNSPGNHPWISEKEKNYILQNTGRSGNKDIPPPPWKHIFTSVPVWALVLAQFGHDWGLFAIVTDLPKYFRQVLNLNLKENGYYSAAPYILMWLFAIAFAYLSDWMTGPKQINVTFVRKLLITIASIGPAIGIIGGSYVGCSKIGALIFFSVGMGTMGAYLPSLKVNPVDLSPNYSGLIMAVVNGLGALSGILGPYSIGMITKNNGYYSAAPYILMWLFAIAFAYLSDWMTGPKQINVTFVRKLLITIASIGPAIGIIGGSYVGCSKIGALIFFSVGMGTMGAYLPSLKVNPVDLSPNYSGLIMAVVNGLGALSGILGPYSIGMITKNATMKEWRTAFWVIFAVLVVTNIIYIIWGTAKQQPWNDTRQMKTQETA